MLTGRVLLRALGDVVAVLCVHVCRIYSFGTNQLSGTVPAGLTALSLTTYVRVMVLATDVTVARNVCASDGAGYRCDCRCECCRRVSW